MTDKPEIMTPDKAAALVNDTLDGHGMGALPETPDARDFLFRAAPDAPPTMRPDKAEVPRDALPRIWDQGPFGACTSFAGLRAFMHQVALQGLATFDPSWQAEYYWCRATQGHPEVDSGSSNRTAFSIAQHKGVAPNDLWPYTKDDFAVPPTPEVEAAAAKLEALAYFAIANGDTGAMMDCLAGSDGTGPHPFVIAFPVYTSFKPDASGAIPDPAPGDTIRGYHAVAVTGYDATDPNNVRFWIDNSWGQGWGVGGRASLSLAYMVDHVSDVRTFRQVTGPPAPVPTPTTTTTPPPDPPTPVPPTPTTTTTAPPPPPKPPVPPRRHRRRWFWMADPAHRLGKLIHEAMGDDGG